jgi:hypothetical protein
MNPSNLHRLINKTWRIKDGGSDHLEGLAIKDLFLRGFKLFGVVILEG